MIRALLAAAGLGAVTYFVTRRRSTLSSDELADWIRLNAIPSARLYADDIAGAAIATCPRDYYPEDPDVALRRWAQLICAIGDKESGFGTAPGYIAASALDPTGWGDHGYGYGFFQIDRRFGPHWTFIQSPAAATVFGQALYASKLLADNFASFRSVPSMAEREHLAVITYNASRKRVAQMIADGATVAAADATTTKTADGFPYGADVLARVG